MNVSCHSERPGHEMIIEYPRISLGRSAYLAARFNHAPKTRAFNESIEAGLVVMRHLVVHSAAN